MSTGTRDMGWKSVPSLYDVSRRFWVLVNAFLSLEGILCPDTHHTPPQVFWLQLCMLNFYKGVLYAVEWAKNLNN